MAAHLLRGGEALVLGDEVVDPAAEGHGLGEGAADVAGAVDGLVLAEDGAGVGALGFGFGGDLGAGGGGGLVREPAVDSAAGPTRRGV